MKQPCRRRRCVYKKTANKKIRSKEGTFSALKMEIFEFLFFSSARYTFHASYTFRAHGSIYCAGSLAFLIHFQTQVV
jgi:hypothetical protein